MTDTLSDHADPTLHAGEPLIQMSGVGKAYGPIRALQDIDLTVSAGEVTCVLGDNGAGKSTLIKIMAGLHPHIEGSLKVDGREVIFSSPRSGPRSRHRHRLPRPRRRLADGSVAQLLPRQRTPFRQGRVQPDEDQGHAED